MTACCKNDIRYWALRWPGRGRVTKNVSAENKAGLCLPSCAPESHGQAQGESLGGRQNSALCKVGLGHLAGGICLDGESFSSCCGTLSPRRGRFFLVNESCYGCTQTPCLPEPDVIKHCHQVTKAPPQTSSLFRCGELGTLLYTPGELEKAETSSSNETPVPGGRRQGVGMDLWDWASGLI